MAVPPGDVAKARVNLWFAGGGSIHVLDFMPKRHMIPIDDILEYFIQGMPYIVAMSIMLQTRPLTFVHRRVRANKGRYWGRLKESDH